jgi:hypothetical protein
MSNFPTPFFFKSLIYLYINKINVKEIKMKKVVRLTESDLNRLVRRIINEQPTPGPGPRPFPRPIPQPIPGPGPEMDLPKCNRVMKSDGGPDKPGSGQSLRGPIDRITYNATVSPEYQGYTVHKDGRPFCFIPNR